MFMPFVAMLRLFAHIKIAAVFVSNFASKATRGNSLLALTGKRASLGFAKG